MAYKLLLILLLLQVHAAMGKGGGSCWDWLGRFFPCIETTETEGEDYTELSKFCQAFCTYRRDPYGFQKCIEECMKKYKDHDFKNGTSLPEKLPVKLLPSTYIYVRH